MKDYDIRDIVIGEGRVIYSAQRHCWVLPGGRHVHDQQSAIDAAHWINFYFSTHRS